MTQTAIALYTFFSAFGIPAFVENTEPDKTPAPYITYELAEPDWRGSHTLHARVWYRSTSFTEICNKVDEIREALGEGISISTDSGVVHLWADDVWAQFMPMAGDPTLKCAYLSFVLKAFTH